jgi:hypothetical protein
MLWPIGARLPAHSFYRRGRNLPISLDVERTRRSYFLLLGLACAGGWSTGLWAMPLLAFAVLEVAWTLAERAGALRGGPLREVEVERVQ